MEVKTYGRLFRHARRVAGLLVAVLGLSDAHAIDTSICGYTQCETAVAAHPDVHSGTATQHYYCYIDPAASSQVTMGYISTTTAGVVSGPFAVTRFAMCNCAAQPTYPAGSLLPPTGLNGKCVAGCKYKPAGDGTCVGAPNGPAGSQTCLMDYKPDGVNCDPVNPMQPPDDTTPTKCTMTAVGADCITPLTPPPPAIPEICGTRNGASVGCVAPPACSSTTAGSICAGNPPPMPPAPTPPATQGPPDVTNPNASYCQGGGCIPIPIIINIYPPPSQPPPDGSCPPGTSGTPPNCVPNTTLCPDGHPPTNGMCIAPWSNCPDGTQPVNGTCPAAQTMCADGTPVHADGTCGNQGGSNLCTNGQPPQNGVCYATCPNGSNPVLGLCPAPQGACPNGSAPVNGQCSQGSQCDPATDPNHCTGNDNGNAGGGETCSAAPFCTGGPIECEILQQAYDTRCAVEAIGKQFKVTGTVPDGHAGESPSDLNVLEERGADMLSRISSSGFFGGGQCPSTPAFTVMGTSFSFFDGAVWWCDLLTAVGGMVLFIGAFVAMRILTSGG